MTDPRPDLSVCIVNHDTPELTRACLRSIFATAGALRLEVFVVNNTPDADGAFGALMREFPSVCAIQNPAPLGFAANQNQMLRWAAGRYLMPLNSDTVVHAGALQTLVAFMDAHPQVGLAGPKLVYADGRLQPSCRDFPALLPAFMEVTGLWRRFKGNRWMAQHVALCDPHTDVTEPDWLSGACYIVRREVYARVGGYDAELFPVMYGEDVEWCWRIRRAGWRIAFVPQAVVTHLESQSAAPDRLYMMYEGSVKFMDKCCSPARSFGVRMVASAGVLLRWLRARDAHERATYRRALRLLLAGKG
ncbi:MAG: glycosyltransferase family 2 protein [Anaerolineae bacterium]|nr:glycosyltransferase family 2 protein [Candidatus Roseilinea sp.]MDW8449183.1 glycosyltransferase family 2 protein [Anaerolineae bacterium]